MIDNFLNLLWTLFCSIVIALLSMYQRAHAYVPKTKTILERTANNHGKGFYTIQLEVSFRNDQGTQTVTENWIIENGESMFVEAKGPGFNYAAVFKGKRKYFMDETGSEKATTLTHDFFENLFHYRGTESLGGELVSMSIVPSKAIVKEAKFRSLKDVKYEKESFLRLSRTAGVVTYALGKPTPVESSPLPGIWIEQDRFHIRKVRFPSQAVITADDYSEYGRSLFYPKTRIVNWGQNSVSITTMKVSAVGANADLKSKLSPSFLRTRKQTQIQYTMADSQLSPLVKEFYLKFR